MLAESGRWKTVPTRQASEWLTRHTPAPPRVSSVQRGRVDRQHRFQLVRRMNLGVAPLTQPPPVVDRIHPTPRAGAPRAETAATSSRAASRRHRGRPSRATRDPGAPKNRRQQEGDRDLCVIPCLFSHGNAHHGAIRGTRRPALCVASPARAVRGPRTRSSRDRSPTRPVFDGLP